MKIMKTTLSILLLSTGTFLLAQNTVSLEKNSSNHHESQSSETITGSSNSKAQDSALVASTTPQSIGIKNEKIEGKVTQVCENRGCWIIIENAKNEKFFVQMQDYSSLQGKKMKGKTVEVVGKSAKPLQNFYTPNKNTGKEKNQVVRFTASGVKVLD